MFLRARTRFFIVIGRLEEMERERGGRERKGGRGGRERWGEGEREREGGGEGERERR